LTVLIAFTACASAPPEQTENDSGPPEDAAPVSETATDGHGGETEVPEETESEAEAVAADEIYYVTRKGDAGINVRSAPSTADAGNKILYIEAGDISVRLFYQGETRAVAENGETYNWFKVKTPDGSIGWVREDVVWECNKSLEVHIVGQWEESKTGRILFNFVPGGLFQEGIDGSIDEEGAYITPSTADKTDLFFMSLLGDTVYVGSVKEDSLIEMLPAEGGMDFSFIRSDKTFDWDQAKNNYSSKTNEHATDSKRTLVETNAQYKALFSGMDYSTLTQQRFIMIEAAFGVLSAAPSIEKAQPHMEKMAAAYSEMINRLSSIINARLSNEFAAQRLYEGDITFGKRHEMIVGLLKEFLLENEMFVNNFTNENVDITSKYSLVGEFSDSFDVLNRLHAQIVFIESY
jgi:hypothetical protein